MHNNAFSSDETAELFDSCLPQLKALRKLHLAGSTDFTEDETCSCAARYLAKAHALEEMSIKAQVGERKATIKVNYATEGDNGTVVVSDASGSEICSAPTSRTEESNKIKIIH